ncbi:hypothetical protein [Pseudophaeobacter sp. C1-32P7]|uniref:hypothetical protein n=1 Tax=Pseudophaeobacter sp. C1-32P7 TaxID=3098142 RepID=UPI0034D7A355
MSRFHSNPDAHGMQFGKAIVTVDLDLMDCMIRAPRPAKGSMIGDIVQSRRFHSLDEIEGARAQQLRLHADGDEVAGDIARALKFAAGQISSKQGKRR